MKPTICVRLASRADLVAIFECDKEFGGNDAKRRAQIAAAVEVGNCVVWDGNGAILGFLVMLPGHFFGRNFLELLVVSSSSRRIGIGRSLLQSAVQSSGSGLWTSTNESNGPMRSLLESEGWTYSGTLTGLDAGDPEMFFYFPEDRAG